MTVETLAKCLPKANATSLELYGHKLIEAMDAFDIDTPQRQAAFLAQIAHESGSLRYVREIASGVAYEGRRDLGNVIDGDGMRYKGRSFIQITGRANYKAVSDALGYDFVERPEDLELPGPAAFASAWFWDSRNLNELADRNEFERISARINGINSTTGKPNGMQDRINHWITCKKVLGVAS